MSVKITDNHPKIVARAGVNVPVFLRLFANGVLSSANPKTPFKDGGLRRRTRVEVLGSKGKIRWLSSHAEYQERGYTSGPIRKYTTSGTGAHFALNAVKRELSKTKEYMRKARIV